MRTRRRCGYHAKLKRKPKESLRSHENAGRLAQSRQPVKVSGVIKQEILSSRKADYLGKAYEMIKSIGHGVDQDKIERAVTVRFAIAPSGRVVDAAIASGTTGSPRFEEQVLEKILAWRFDNIKAVGNDIVTVPFNFSE